MTYQVFLFPKEFSGGGGWGGLPTALDQKCHSKLMENAIYGWKILPSYVS